MAFGSWNSVPDRPDWYYGLAERNGEGVLTVAVHELGGGRRSFTIEGRYWTSDCFGEDSIATKAKRQIDTMEGGS
jgi:hypothetical protein